KNRSVFNCPCTLVAGRKDLSFRSQCRSPVIARSSPKSTGIRSLQAVISRSWHGARPAASGVSDERLLLPAARQGSSRPHHSKHSPVPFFDGRAGRSCLGSVSATVIHNLP